MAAMATVSTSRPLLESGDHLTPEEFDAIYTEEYEGRAELIDGLVYVPSPVRFGVHSSPHGAVATVLGVYSARTIGVELGIDSTIRFPEGTRVQPDICLIRSGPGGPDIVRDYLVAAPGFVAEIAASSANIDMHEKKELYRRNRVPEYLVWRVIDGEMDLFRLDGGAYVKADPDPSGVLHSAEFPGLVIPAAQLIAADFAGAFSTVLAALDARG
jgi:Uma2 family endonuclease